MEQSRTPRRGIHHLTARKKNGAVRGEAAVGKRKKKKNEAINDERLPTKKDAATIHISQPKVISPMANKSRKGKGISIYKQTGNVRIRFAHVVLLPIFYSRVWRNTNKFLFLNLAISTVNT